MARECGRGRGQGRGRGLESRGGHDEEEVNSGVGNHQENEEEPQPNGGGKPIDPNLAALLQNLTQAIAAGVAQATQVQGSPPAQVPLITKDPLESFQKRNPKLFSGAPGTEKPEDWLENMDKVFGTMNCTDTQKVTFATFVLQGEASQWWKSEKRSAEQKGIEIYTWVMFLEAFNNKYFPPSMRERRMVEFLELEQGDMTVDEYDAKFVELSRYAPSFFDDENQKARKFERGLNYKIRYRLTALKLPTYAEVLDRARVVEQESEDYKKMRDEKKQEPEDRPSRRRGRIDNTSVDSYKRREIKDDSDKDRNLSIRNHDWNANIKCHTCGGWHETQRCYRTTGACFNCGKTGHQVKNCPEPLKARFSREQEARENQKPKGPGRVYAMTLKDQVAPNL